MGLLTSGLGVLPASATEVLRQPLPNDCLSAEGLLGADTAQILDDPCSTAITMAEDGIRFYEQGKAMGNQFLMKLGIYAYLQALHIWNEHGCEQLMPGQFPAPAAGMPI